MGGKEALLLKVKNHDFTMNPLSSTLSRTAPQAGSEPIAGVRAPRLRSRGLTKCRRTQRRSRSGVKTRALFISTSLCCFGEEGGRGEGGRGERACVLSSARKTIVIPFALLFNSLFSPSSPPFSSAYQSPSSLSLTHSIFLPLTAVYTRT